MKQQQQLELQSKQLKTAPPVPAMPNPPPIDAPTSAPVSRSMSRYHRRPTTAHAAAQKAPPPRSNTDITPPLPANGQAAISNAARLRALSSPQQQSQARVANGTQKRPPTASKTRPDALPLVAKGGREPSRTARDEAKQVLQDEAERQRRIHEKQKAEKRAKLEAAEQARREKEEQLRREKEEEEEARVRAEQDAQEAQRLHAQREAEEAEQLRRQQEEQERGKRLQKAESAAHLRKREEAARKAPDPEPTSPPKMPFFSRRRAENAPTAARSPPSRSTPRQTSNGSQPDLETIRPGGGGAVLGVDAPISAVNAGDRVRLSDSSGNNAF